MQVWSEAAEQDRYKGDQEHTKVVEKFLYTNGGRQDAYRKFHLCNNAGFLKYSAAPALDTGLDEPPG